MYMYNNIIPKIHIVEMTRRRRWSIIFIVSKQSIRKSLLEGREGGRQRYAHARTRVGDTFAVEYNIYVYIAHIINGQVRYAGWMVRGSATLKDHGKVPTECLGDGSARPSAFLLAIDDTHVDGQRTDCMTTRDGETTGRKDRRSRERAIRLKTETEEQPFGPTYRLYDGRQEKKGLRAAEIA